MHDSSNNDLNSNDFTGGELKLIHDALAERFGKPFYHNRHNGIITLLQVQAAHEFTKEASAEINTKFLYNDRNHSAGIIFHDVNS